METRFVGSVSIVPGNREEGIRQVLELTAEVDEDETVIVEVHAVRPDDVSQRWE